MRISAEIDIERPRQDVWFVIADPSTHTAWRPALVDFRQVSDGPLEVGSQIREVLRFRGRELELDDVVTALEPPRQLSLRGGWKAAAFESDLLLEESPAGTYVTFDWTMHPKTFVARIGMPLLRRAMRRATEEELVELKRYVEGRPLDTD
jgi:uncharacterized protein YndB with AHSA1/START domain